MQGGRVVNVRGLISLFCESGTPVRIWTLRQKMGCHVPRLANDICNVVGWIRFPHSPHKLGSYTVEVAGQTVNLLS